MGQHRYGKGSTEVLPVKGTDRFRVIVAGRPVGMVAPTTEKDGIEDGWKWSSYNLTDGPGLSWSGFHSTKAEAVKLVVRLGAHRAKRR